MSDAARIYADGTYRDANPDWHSGDSGWKAERIIELLNKHLVPFESCVEVGCGAGQILQALAKALPKVRFSGFDVSPDAAALWPRSSRVDYFRADFTTTSEHHDLLLLIDVIEHVEDYMGFLRKLSSRATWVVLHIPLDLHVSGLLRHKQIDARNRVGHLHYFSKETALATLQDTGYEVVESQLTKLSQETSESRTRATNVINYARRVLELASSELAATMLGGYSLLVLCRPHGLSASDSTALGNDKGSPAAAQGTRL